MALVFRDVKGAPLTHAEVDGNFRHLTGSQTISGSIEVQGNILEQAVGATSTKTSNVTGAVIHRGKTIDLNP